jgi:hypothetical protein
MMIKLCNKILTYCLKAFYKIPFRGLVDVIKAIDNRVPGVRYGHTFYTLSGLYFG